MKHIFILFCALTSFGANAAILKKKQNYESQIDSVFDKCIYKGCAPTFTEKLKHDYRYKNPRSYNDLTTQVGTLENEYVEKIMIRGVVLDKNCIPISSARITVVQVDEYGDLRLRNMQKHKSPLMHRQITTSGVTYTNNMGYFEFFTVEPSVKYIDLQILQQNFKAPTYTKVYLTDRLGKPNYNKATLNMELSDKYDMSVYDISIALSTKDRYRKF